jgi:hypothetical protein
MFFASILQLSLALRKKFTCKLIKQSFLYSVFSQMSPYVYNHIDVTYLQQLSVAYGKYASNVLK